MALTISGIMLVGGGLIYGGLQLMNYVQAKVDEDPFGVPKEYQQHEQARQAAFRDYLEEEKIEEEKSKQAFIKVITTYVCGGNQTVGREVAAELNAVGEELNALRTDADANNDPSDHRAFWMEHFTRRVLANQIIVAWLGGKSPALLTDVIWGRPKAAGEGAATPDFLIAGSYSSNGTGFFISSDGWLLTNEHVVRYVDSVDIRSEDGVIRPAKVIKKDAANDLALIKCEGSANSWLTLSTDKIDMGAGVFTIGFPKVDMQGIAPKFTDGRISSMSGYRDDPNQFQISVPVQPGNSGGPLIHFASGRVAGVINARLNGQDAENVAYAIKTDVALKFLSSVSGLKLPASTSTPANAEEQIQKTRDSVVLVLVK